MLQRTLKLAALTTWCGVLSCLFVVFIGCTSTSLRKTNGLFYIKVSVPGPLDTVPVNGFHIGGLYRLP